MAEQLNKVVVELPPLPQPRVAYDSDRDILVIESGESSAVGEEMAEGIIIHYDKDDETVAADEATRAVAVFIDGAEYALKPFVDAILAKYGVTQETSLNGQELQGSRSTPTPNLTTER